MSMNEIFTLYKMYIFGVRIGRIDTGNISSPTEKKTSIFILKVFEGHLWIVGEAVET